MAIAINNSTTYETTVTNNSFSFSHTVNTGLSNYALVLAVITIRDATTTDGAQHTITGASYNSVGLTQVIQASGSSTNRGHQTALFILPTPATGSNTVNVTTSLNVGGIAVFAMTLTGVNLVSPTGDTEKDQTNGPPVDVDITTTALNSYIICVMNERGDDNYTYVAMTDTTKVADLHSNAGAPSNVDCQGAVGIRQTSSIGTYTVGFSSTSSNSGDGIIAAEFLTAPNTWVSKIMIF